MPAPVFQDHRRDALDLVDAVLRAANPAEAMLRAWPAHLSDGRRTTLIAIGKASLEMAAVAVQKLGPSLQSAVIAAVPQRTPRHTLGGRVRIFPADHPWPTPRNLAAAQAVADAARLTPSDHRLILLISGGGSAHLTLPAAGITLDDLVLISRLLQRAGAPIQHLNTVRKHTEQLKGGRLATLFPSRDLHVFVLSDVMGDPLDVIASGPAAPDPTTYTDALAVLDRYALLDAVPAITAHLQAGAAGLRPETPKPGILPDYPHTIVASNNTALDAATSRARELGYHVAAVRRQVEGPAGEIGAALAQSLLDLPPAPGRATCLIIGGEPTVDVRMPGPFLPLPSSSSSSSSSFDPPVQSVKHEPDAHTPLGGPSQELALAAALKLAGHDGAAVLAFSTDGVDGPTDAAGAIITGHTAAACLAAGSDPSLALSRHDSHYALDRAGALLRTGPTGTNVNHLAIAFAYPRSDSTPIASISSG